MDAVTLLTSSIPPFTPLHSTYRACGVTPQAVVMNSKPEFCITHSPGFMLVLDVTNEALSLD